MINFVLSVWFICQYSDHSIFHKVAVYYELQIVKDVEQSNDRIL